MHEFNASESFNAVRADSLAEQVHGQLSRMILSGSFGPGDRINLRQLARDFEVSVTPVREAVLRLVSDGILQTTDRNAIVVPIRDEDEIREIFHIRRTLEGELAEDAADKLGEDDIDALREIQADFIVALEQKDYRDALRLNANLHFTIYGAARMPLRLKIIEGLWLRIGPALRNMYPMLAIHRAGASPHDQILESLSAGKADKLREAVIADLNRGEEALLKYMRSAQFARSFTAQSGIGR